MVDLIYDFINDVLLQESTLPGRETLAVLLTWTILISFVFVLIKLVMWAFNLGRRPRNHFRR